MYRIIAYITTVRLLIEQRKTIEEAAHNIDRVGQALEGRRRKFFAIIYPQLVLPICIKWVYVPTQLSERLLFVLLQPALSELRRAVLQTRRRRIKKKHSLALARLRWRVNQPLEVRIA